MLDFTEAHLPDKMAEPSEVNGEVLPSGPQAAATTGLGNGISAHHEFLDKVREPPITRLLKAGDTNRKMLLELQDGSTYQGYSFGASRSCGGELVFQTGMFYPILVFNQLGSKPSMLDSTLLLFS